MVMTMASDEPWEPATEAIDAMFDDDLDAAEARLLESLGAVRKQKQRRER